MNSASTAEAFDSPALVGNSPAFVALMGRLRGVAKAQRTTLISGPTGSGKDVVARSLHAASTRRGRPYVTVHCGALPEALVEAEMFGHSRGAFTGATQSRGGLVRAASGGTLFLDEIDSLPASAQAKLLRFLETGEYRSVGCDHVDHSDAWVIAATNQRLSDRVREGLFRADLMYRVAVVELPVPPLSERAEDIPGLAEHFLAQVDAGKRFDQEAVRAMQSYDWPGNVRELKHRVESAALLTERDTIDAQALALAPPASPAPSCAAVAGCEEPALEQRLWSLIDSNGLSLAQAIGECERMLVRAALRAEKNNRTRAAGRLGIHVRTIFKKLR
jgi:two-component system NtrC family response regulator/two-component system response regulator AtoC